MLVCSSFSPAPKTAARPLKRTMPTDPVYATSGSETEKIDVRLSYGIVRLFSEGLYASPNKAVEELVANSFDAGARRVAVLLPADFHDQGATIVVLDDGEGMDAAGLKTHWLIGKSLKRALQERPLGRQQIGKFGIGKLATYVLANRLTHISKKGGKYYSTSMNFKDVDDRGDEEVEPKSPIRIVLRQLSDDQARQALKAWIDSPTFLSSGFKLFGTGASKSWTFAILSDLKPKVHQIERGRLEWVLRTALPLRDDFEVYFNGAKLVPSKGGKGRLKRWVLGSDILELPKPAENQTEVSEDDNEDANSTKRFGLTNTALGRITGYAEAYKDLLTGKSDDIFRSHGFFVYVRDRLINVEDGHFGIPADELRHGTFGRIRVVVHMDGLDGYLQSDRERIREGPVRVAAQNVLRAIFNHVRQFLNKHDAGLEPGTKLANTLAATPGSVSRRPIIELVRASLAGKASSNYLKLPPDNATEERDTLVATLETRAETPELFVAGSEVVFDVAPDRGIAMYDVLTGVMRINGFHPFVAAFYDDFSNTTSGLPLELFAMAEVLLESQLFQAGHSQVDIDATMTTRDQYLRDVASRAGSRTALAVANALRGARNDQHKLEVELVAAFDKLGFRASQPGRKSARDPGKDKPDGLAVAVLGGDGSGNSLRYSVTLEAKSTHQDGKRVPAGDVGVGVVALHRDKFSAEHALVVAPSFSTTRGEEASVAQQIASDRASTIAAGKPRTITLITIDDLARLVRIAPTKKLGLTRLRELFQSCSLPEQSKVWVDKLESSQPKRPPYREIIETIYQLQRDHHGNDVEYYGLMVALGVRTPPVKISPLQELIDLCRGMSQMAPGYMSASVTAVGIEQSPANVLAAVESATKAHLADKT
jgi:hypothetical protein